MDSKNTMDQCDEPVAAITSQRKNGVRRSKAVFCLWGKGTLLKVSICKATTQKCEHCKRFGPVSRCCRAKTPVQVVEVAAAASSNGESGGYMRVDSEGGRTELDCCLTHVL